MCISATFQPYENGIGSFPTLRICQLPLESPVQSQPLPNPFFALFVNFSKVLVLPSPTQTSSGPAWLPPSARRSREAPKTEPARPVSTWRPFFFWFGGILGSASGAEFPVSLSNHVGFKPILLYSSTHHSPESFTNLKTVWAQDAWLQWSYENWYFHLDISRWPYMKAIPWQN